MADNPEQATKPQRKVSVDEATLQTLEKRLKARPDKADLVDRNILKDDQGVSPAIIAAREQLKRSQLEDKLEHAIQHRPKAEDLVKEGILNGNCATSF